MTAMPAVAGELVRRFAIWAGRQSLAVRVALVAAVAAAVSAI